MATLFLSPMLDMLHRPAMVIAGAWERRTPDVAGTIAAALPPASTTIAQMAQSVPSVWGYVRFFAHAFRDRGHVLHAPVVELWRRFITIVALRDVLPPDTIRLVAIKIPCPTG